MSSTRSKLIQLLSENDEVYISGQMLSNELGISRSAIWKHMNELKKDGYIIEAKARKGYRIVQAPEKLSGNTVAWGLETKWLGKRIVHKESLHSTQRLAHELAQDKAAHGTVVIADEQVKGKGRMGRAWHSEKNKGIWMSMILRPNILPYLAPQLTLLTATVLAEVMDTFIGIQPQIKWPNDILIHGRKVAGILTEMQAEQDQVLYVIIGIGINVNQTMSDLPEDVREKATSFRMESNEKKELTPIIQQILTTFEKKFSTYLEEGFRPVQTNWENYGFRMHETLHIKTGKKEWHGVFLGIAEDGALLAKRPDGEIEKVYSGEISWF